jgi:hypothetical protein
VVPWPALAAPAQWLAPYDAARRRVLQAHHAGAALVDTLNAALARQPSVVLAAGPLRFVPQSDLPVHEAYEAHIARTACVPTRENGHDLFNALVWMTFPALKRRLHELQAAEIGRAGVGPARGALRDAATLLDENGAFWAAPPALREAFAARDWHALFVSRRAAWHGTRPILFGHALLDKLVQPRKAITAHVWPGDAAAALAQLTPQALSAKPFLPLPVLGVPGWWPANETPGFYEDRTIFRPSPARGLL